MSSIVADQDDFGRIFVQESDNEFEFGEDFREFDQIRETNSFIFVKVEFYSASASSAAAISKRLQ